MFSTDDQQYREENQTPTASKKIRYHGKFSLYFMHVLPLDPIADVTCISKVNHRRAGKGPFSQSFVTVFTVPASSTRSSVVSICDFLQESKQIVGCVSYSQNWCGDCAVTASAPVWEVGERAVTELVMLGGVLY